MNKKTRSDLIAFRLGRAAEAFELAKISVSKGYWNSVASELYYTCFYTITALFAKYDIDVHTHKGVKSIFSLEFIKQEKVDSKWGKLLNELFDKRQDSDYGDFVTFKEEELLPLVNHVEEFRKVINKLLETE